MSLVRQLQLRKGPVAVSVFQADDDGRILLSMDKGSIGGSPKGTLFTESEVADLADLMRDYLESDAELFHPTDRTIPEPQLPVPAPHVREEIELAIQQAMVATPTKKQPAKITVLPCLPEYSYVYTCPKCRCHVASNLRVGPTSNLKLCSNCSHVLAAFL